MILSIAYKLLFVEGRLEQARRMIERMGRVKLGDPDESTKLTIAACFDLDRLELLFERILEVNSWEELLATPDRAGHASAPVLK
jgi:hypothetical protein